MVYDNEVTMVLVYLLIPTHPELPCRCKCLVASSAALVHAVHPQHQKMHQWKKYIVDMFRLSLSTYDMISWLWANHHHRDNWRNNLMCSRVSPMRTTKPVTPSLGMRSED
jgi:hypothetical protein